MDLTLLVLSDLHAFDGNNVAGIQPSFFDISLPEGGGADNPIADLKRQIKKDKMRADYLICCGDLGDKAYPAAIERAWNELQTIKRLVGARRILTTVGNHDMDSRHKFNDHDAKGVLLDLAPGFPFDDENENNQFWAQHFTIINNDDFDVRFVVINSTGYHGESETELVRGRVSARTLSRLLGHLRKGGRKSRNILLCHHHPQKHSELKRGDYDDMKGGYELLAALDPAEFGPWIIIHGHKHHPKLSYAQGGTVTPVIFSAGSCAAIADPALSGHAINQVYSLTLPTPKTYTSVCEGIFRSWDWAPGRGWNISQPGSGLPGRGGFGYRCDLGKLAAKLNSFVSGEAKWKEIIINFPEIEFLIPSDLALLCRCLESRFNFGIEHGTDGIPILIQKT